MTGFAKMWTGCAALGVVVLALAGCGGASEQETSAATGGTPSTAATEALATAIAQVMDSESVTFTFEFAGQSGTAWYSAPGRLLLEWGRGDATLVVGSDAWDRFGRDERWVHEPGTGHPIDLVPPIAFFEVVGDPQSAEWVEEGRSIEYLDRMGGRGAATLDAEGRLTEVETEAVTMSLSYGDHPPITVPAPADTVAGVEIPDCAEADPDEACVSTGLPPG